MNIFEQVWKKYVNASMSALPGSNWSIQIKALGDARKTKESLLGNTKMGYRAWKLSGTYFLVGCDTVRRSLGDNDFTLEEAIMTHTSCF